MTTIPAHSCIHRANGIDPVPGCAICGMREARSRRLDARHFGARQIVTPDDLDPALVIDDEPAA